GFLGFGSNQNLALWDVASGRRLIALHAHTGTVDALAFSPDGHTLVSGGDDNTATLWDMPSGRSLRRLAGHASKVTDIAFSTDGKTITTGAEDGKLKFWDAESGREINRTSTIADLDIFKGKVATSPDGKTRVRAGSGIGSLQISDTTAQRYVAID